MTCLFNTGPWGMTIVELCSFIISGNSGSLHMNHNVSRRVCITMVQYSRSFVISGNPGDQPKKKVVSAEEKAQLWCKQDWPVLRVAYHRMFLCTTWFNYVSVVRPQQGVGAQRRFQKMVGWWVWGHHGGAQGGGEWKCPSLFHVFSFLKWPIGKWLMCRSPLKKRQKGASEISSLQKIVLKGLQMQKMYANCHKNILESLRILPGEFVMRELD